MLVITGATGHLENLIVKSLLKDISDNTDKGIVRTIISDEECLNSLLQYGTTEFEAKALLDVFQASRDGGFNHTSTLLETLIGHKHVNILTYLANQ